MRKVMCEVIIRDVLGNNHVYKCCGISQKNAEEKLLKEFPGDKIVKSTVLYEYEE